MTRKKSRSSRIEPKYNLNESLERYRALLDPKDFSLLLEELERPLLSALRINPLKAAEKDLESWKIRYGWETRQVPYCPMGFWLVSRKINPGKTLEHKMGAFYLQDAASMLPVELFDFKSNAHPLILDMAASPGGKTTQLISQTLDHGLVIANDSSQSRIAALQVVLQTWGAINYAISCHPGELYGILYPETFDAVLLDAPCSMDGLRATEAHPLRPITEKERASLARRQILLLSSALQTVRLGGQVVYSTCTLAPEEDEAVLDAVFRKYPGMFNIEDVSSSRHIKGAGLKHDGDVHFHPEISNSIRLWPHTYGTAGFFAAKLIKTGTIPSGISPKFKPFISQREYFEVTPAKQKIIIDQILDDFGFDMLPFLDDQELEIMQSGRKIMLMPRSILEFRDVLNIRYAGMMLAERVGDSFEISHEFVSRFGGLFNKGVFILPREMNKAWLRGEDLQKIGLSDLLMGRIFAIQDEEGRNFGRGRVTSDRLKNLLPRRMVL